MTKKRILAISGSTRAHSSNEKVLQVLAKLMEEFCEIELFDSIAILPHFNPDLDQEPLPETIQILREKLGIADGLLICTPEYVFSMPGSLKNLLEWQVSTVLLTDKPTAFVVAAGSGEMAFKELDLVLQTLGAKMEEQTKLLISGIRGKFNKEGELIDNKTEALLRNLAKVFLRLLND